MTVLVALDKFKGSLTSFQANAIVGNAIYKVMPSAIVHSFPMADGGDGFSDVMQHYLQTKTVKVSTINAIQKPINSDYQWEDKSKTALIEVAKASGMQQLAKHQLNPLYATTYGTGILIKHAIDNGAKKIILGLGGSATNDGGIGILSALGFEFLDASGNILAPIGAYLPEIMRIKKPISGIPNVMFEIACDVDNVLYGKQGAAYMYAAQKGASTNDITFLNEGLKHLARILSLECDVDYSSAKGSGAAGGIPVSILSFFDANISKGFNLVLKQSKFIDFASKADLFITGEGKIDNQSLYGKVISGIASVAKLHGKPCVAYCGINASGDTLKNTFDAIYPITDDSITEAIAIENAPSLLLKKVTETIVKYL